MIIDLEQDVALPDFTADVCIAGAGAAGIVLAAELVRQGRRVLLLESGGAGLEPAAQELNACLYTGQPHQGASTGRFRALGGTTTMWGGQVLELAEEDFAVRPWVPASGWPFGKDELRPYYERAMIAEGLDRVCRSDEEIWRRVQADKPALGTALESYLTRWCPEPNFARLYGDVLNSVKLLVFLHATVTGMVMSANGERVAGLRCRTVAGREDVFSAAQYVLSLGTIETVRFLLQPVAGSTPAWNNSGLLGRHFQSHIDYNSAKIPPSDALRLRPWFANVYLDGYKYHPKCRLAHEQQEQLGVLNIGASITCIHPAEMEIRTAKRLARNFIHGRYGEVVGRDIARFFQQLPTMLSLGYGYRVQHRAWWAQDSSFWLRVHCEQEPSSQSRITLSDVRDAMGLLQAKIDWRVSALEWKTIRRFTELAQKSFAALGMSHFALRPELQQEDGYREIVFDNSYHYMGGTRMAESPNDGIVDRELKLHGVENAYVCSASVFPTGGSSNPTHTLIALAIRLADHLTNCKAASVSISGDNAGA